ncbi:MULTISPECIES: MipA/OmpV family protein [unclassified Pseudoalteromonas]|uniref:MipA/OmpV family protein n=1 Tax=unclassified Pseudoalteromonas TaxID=194690 RepID=UPI0020984610|nr:MipA/OmpV family protein [Pseudoalteromonas sp. XMcav2-N]MCO7188565.1 MipA/OmpV family protein [Pseudoalteromonas sp. XMcav2-N]
MNKTVSLISLALMSFSTLADDKEQGAQWGIGAAVVSQDQGYTDVGNETILVPALAIQYGNFSLLGPRGSYKVWQQENIEFSVVGQLRLDGYEEADGDIFLGMEDRDMSFDFGFEGEFDTEFGEFGFSFMHDVTSTHKGYEASVSYGVPFTLGDGRITPYVSASYLSEDLVDYYYGVLPTEQRAGRNAYTGDATMNLEVGVSSDWFFGRNHMIKADLSYTAYGSEIKDSPLIEQSGAVQLLLGYVYVF